MNKEIKPENMRIHSRADELIACLEGEIAKRDETIARLEPQLNRAIQANYDLREELAACRVAVENCEVFRARIAELEQDLAYFPSTVRLLAETVTEREAEINQLRAELSDAKAIIDGLRGENEALHAQVKVLQSDANSWQSGYEEGRRMGGKHCSLTIDQQAQRIGELEGLLRESYEDGEYFMEEGLLERIEAALSAGKEWE